MGEIGLRRVARRLLASLVVALAVTVGAVALCVPAVAVADDADLDAMKREWQGRYRDLRMQEARLVETVKLATKEYADSNRRNYRRSGVRHFHRTNANEAKAQLAVVRQKIEAMYGQVVAAGGSINWLYEVDDEPIAQDRVEGLGVYEDQGHFGGKGAYSPDRDRKLDGDDEETDSESGSDETADDGRNPLYSNEGDGQDEGGDGEVPAKAGKPDPDAFDYDDWIEDRGDYEQKRAKERHLRPDDY